MSKEIDAALSNGHVVTKEKPDSGNF